jgi:putative PIN family toxin of toxin-antitoxin system
MMNIVLDTNCLLMSLSRRSSYYLVWRDFVDGKYTLCITNEILAEYEEILTQKVGTEITSNVINAILDLPNTKLVQVFYHLHLITADSDDNKFVDCAFKTNA